MFEAMLRLYRRGKLEEWELANAARYYIQLYKKEGVDKVSIPFMDLTVRKKRYVVFQKMEGVSEWVFTDITD